MPLFFDYTTNRLPLAIRFPKWGLLFPVGMVVALDGCVGVAVGGLVLTVDMGVGMNMAVGMGVDQVAMAMFKVVGVAVGMGVLQADGILHHQHRCGDHNGQAPIEPDTGPLPQQGHAEGHPRKGAMEYQALVLAAPSSFWALI